MNYLLDTHYLIWTLTDTGKLSGRLKELITNPDNNIIVSAVTFWEISLKYSLGKLKLSNLMPEDLPDLCRKMGLGICALSPEESSSYHRLKAAHHRDPFDRMLIWQAIVNEYTFVSSDKEVKKYISEGLKMYTE